MADTTCRHAFDALCELNNCSSVVALLHMSGNSTRACAFLQVKDTGPCLKLLWFCVGWIQG